MTKLLEKAMEQVRALPEARQNEIAEMLFDLTGRDAARVSLTEEQWADIRRRMAEPRRYASDAEVEAFFKRNDR